MLQAALDAVLKHHREHGLLTLVPNFIVPKGNLAPALAERGNHRDFGRLVRAVNRYLDQALAACRAPVADVELLDNAPAWAAPYSGRIDTVAHVRATYSLQTQIFSELVFHRIEAIYRTVHQVDTVRIVIFDLDNTPWRGQIAEHY